MRKLKILEKNNKLITYTNESNSLTVSETADKIIQKDIIRFFSKEDRRSIRNRSENIDLWGSQPDFIWFVMLNSLFITILFIAIPLSPNPVNVLSTIQPSGILIFPLTFVILDTINSTLRYKYARLTVIISASLCFIASILIMITFRILDITEPYSNIFYPLIKLYIINGVCLLAADQANNLFFKYLNDQLGNNKLWLKCLCSTIIGQILYTIIWIALFFNTSTTQEVLMKIIDNYTFKVIYAAMLIPLTYALVITYKNFIKRKY